MRKALVLAGIAVIVGLGWESGAVAAPPGGKFLERLNRARTRVRPRRPERAPAPETTGTPTGVNPPAAVPSPSRPPETRSSRQNGLPVPSPAVSRPVGIRPPAPGTTNYGRITPAPNPRSFKTARVTYSIVPRPAGSPSSPNTGDVFLVAQPEETRVFFYPNGGAQLPQTTTANLRERPAGKMSILAYAPALKGRVTARIPVEAGHITTVRFVFPSRSGGPALPIPGER